jgi:hypothetical protein
MFAIDAADVAAICSAKDAGGDMAAAEEVRRRFPALSIRRARVCARMITGPWPVDDETDDEADGDGASVSH